MINDLINSQCCDSCSAVNTVFEFEYHYLHVENGVCYYLPIYVINISGVMFYLIRKCASNDDEYNEYLKKNRRGNID